ncbi:MAG TPA: hypothetical protein VGY53_09665 [Isosphaeraceae bacterium]|jgi:hypothetical protein|nr:hypothetical protein [Isosphaeraceae bacterium]
MRIFIRLLFLCFKSLINGLRRGDPYIQTGVACTVAIVGAALVVHYFRRKAASGQPGADAEELLRTHDDFPA